MIRSGGSWWQRMVVALVLWMLVSPVIASESLPAAPGGMVLDEAGLFDRDPEGLAKISSRLLELRDEHDLDVYLVVYGGLLDTTLEKRTQQLYDLWIGRENDGLVVVWDSDTGLLDFGIPTAGYYDIDGEGGPVTRLPDHRLRPVLNEVMASVEGIEDKPAYVDRLSVVLVTRLGWMLRKDQPQGGVSAGSVAIATVLVGGALGMLGLWAGKLLRNSEVEAARECYFPDVLVGARLGAAFGGGRIAVVDYNREEPEEEE
jgi:hypothetical protein